MSISSPCTVHSSIGLFHQPRIGIKYRHFAWCPVSTSCDDVVESKTVLSDTAARPREEKKHKQTCGKSRTRPWNFPHGFFPAFFLSLLLLPSWFSRLAVSADNKRGAKCENFFSTLERLFSFFLRWTIKVEGYTVEYRDEGERRERKFHVIELCVSISHMFDS